MAGRGRRSAGRGSVSRLLSALEYSVSAAQGSQLGPHHAQIVLELLEPGLILSAERLNLAVERLQLPLGRGQLRGVLVAEDPHLIDEELDPLVDLGDVGREGCRTALLAAVNLVGPATNTRTPATENTIESRRAKSPLRMLPTP